jgi:hypothetical protein
VGRFAKNDRLVGWVSAESRTTFLHGTVTGA